jgi:hypothetical protein
MPYRLIRSRSCSGLGGSSADHSSCSFLKYPSMAGCVEDEEASGRVPSIAEGVGLPSGHPHEIARAGGHGRFLEFDDDGAFEDEERLRAVRVPVRGWPAPAGGKGALHEREIAICLFCYRLECHHAAPSPEDNPLTGSEERRLFPGTSFVDPAHRPIGSGGSVAISSRRLGISGSPKHPQLETFESMEVS